MLSALTQSRQVPLTQGTSVKSDTGQTYRIEELLTHGGKTALHVYRASAEGKQYVVKNMIPGEFDYQLDLQKSLSSYPNIRTVADTVRESEVFIYPFLRGDLLRFGQKNLSKETRRNILRSALQGLVDMHAHDIVHNDIKPNNILVDYTEPATEGQEIIINQVQISDLDDTVIVPPGRWLRGPLCGNAMWRSAESWARSRQNQSSDVFSFALVMVYVMANQMVLRVPDDQLNAEDSWRHVLPLHLSYFTDVDDLEKFLEHIGEENPYFQRMLELVSTFGPENPLRPVKRWGFLEPELRDLVEKMTPLDPRRRITSKEALEHPWFTRTE